jgi:23S rRNA (adenine2503-C2)-methyltransferase
MNYKIDELEAVFKNLYEKKFVAYQIFEWIHRKNIFDFNSMSNISKELKNKLFKDFFISKLKILEVKKSFDSEKFLIELEDKNLIECCLMTYSFGNTICVSSQVGCKMGCSFCESKKNNFIRNLEAGEICSQIYLINKTKKISRIAVMGIGEPLDNYDNLLKFIKIITSPNGFNISQRNITISTCGLVNKIEKLARENLKINLAVSLHAPNDYIRNKIMKISQSYSIDKILIACDNYFKITKRRVTFEYLLLNNINDSKENAEELCKRLKKISCHVNLIKFNKITDNLYTSSNKIKQDVFFNILKKNKINVTIRRSLGSNISSACGQMSYRVSQKQY